MKATILRFNKPAYIIPVEDIVSIDHREHNIIVTTTDSNEIACYHIKID